MLWLSLALARPQTAVVVGSGVVYRAGCGNAPACIDDTRSLQFADDDAWKASLLLRQTTGPDGLVVLAEPDGSTADLDWSVDGRPTRLNLIDGVRSLTASRAEPIDVLVYIAAHGSPGQLHLADGRFRFADLRSALQTALDPGDRLTLVADACHSATWRSANADRGVRPARTAPVDRSPAGTLEAVVMGVTPEDDDLMGGAFSHLVFSALSGAADRDGDGAIAPEELSDFVHAYAVASEPAFSPRVRVPLEPGRHFPRLEGTPVTLQSNQPTRWFVEHPSGRVIADAVAVDGAAVTLRLPPDEYTLHTVPMTQTGELFRPDPNGLITARHLDLSGESGVLGELQEGGEAARVGGRAVGARLRGGRHVQFGLGLMGETGWLVPNNEQFGLAWEMRPARPRRGIPFIAGTLGTSPGSVPVHAGSVLAGLDLTIYARGPVRWGARGSGGVEGFLVPELGYRSGGPRLQLGSRFEFGESPWVLSVEPLLSTAWHVRSDGAPVNDGVRPGLSVGGLWTW